MLRYSLLTLGATLLVSTLVQAINPYLVGFGVAAAPLVTVIYADHKYNQAVAEGEAIKRQPNYDQQKLKNVEARKRRFEIMRNVSGVIVEVEGIVLSGISDTIEAALSIPVNAARKANRFVERHQPSVESMKLYNDLELLQ